MRAKHISLLVKVLYTLWFVTWVPTYWRHNGWQNFLWFCDLANFIVLVGLWKESRLLLSSQAIGVLLIQLVWNVDFVGRLALGFHPVGGTEYMFDAAKPMVVRSHSLFHIFVPVVLLWGVHRLGYDRRALRFQGVLAAVLLPLSYFLTDPSRNINWVFRPFGLEQVWLPPLLYLGVCMVAYPLLLLWPAHLSLHRWAGRGTK
ncbi:MAG: hypothetical protein K0U98_27735 [Deltaproteobacteria bacterium]|nr:hypothetical protein [Deltaproteobacteria bacterium]